jgi:signal transduction histidine kinase
MPTGGRLTIMCRREGGEAAVSFADTGTGINLALADRIFEPFFSTKPRGKGTGLGLSICREILERIGGSIAADNRPEGGAVFTLRVPLRPPAGGPPADAPGDPT